MKDFFRKGWTAAGEQSLERYDGPAYDSVELSLDLDEFCENYLQGKVELLALRLDGVIEDGDFPV